MLCWLLGGGREGRKGGQFLQDGGGVSRVPEEKRTVGRRVRSLELNVMLVIIATTPHLLLQDPTRDGELDSSSNWQLDPTELASKFTSHTKALILNTPNNPVGKVPERTPSGGPSRLGSCLCCVGRLSFFICEMGGQPVT